jgi:outer membrane putative beta-barrel porin/alpha-amylase
MELRSSSEWPFRVAIAVLVLFVPVAASAQERVEPDQPDVTNGTHIVDVGLLQIELGGVYTRSDSTSRSGGSPVTARLGLTDWCEVRIGADGWLVQSDGTTTVSGAGNLLMGAKLRLWPGEGGIPVLAILPTVVVPTASADKGLGSGIADYFLAFLTGTDLGRHSHVDMNYGIGAIGDETTGGHFTQQLVSVSFSSAVSDNWNPYLEAFWISRQDPGGGRVMALDTGAIYELGTRYALDGGVQVGLTHAAPAFSAFGGVSVVVGNILGDHGVHARSRRRGQRPPPKH